LLAARFEFNNPRGKSPGSVPTPGDESEGRILALLNQNMIFKILIKILIDVETLHATSLQGFAGN
jgi:hypothetical protein